jgi:hypothetical protein
MAEHYTRNPNTHCNICGKAVYRRPVELERSGGRAFCSWICYGISCRKEKPCVVCGTPIIRSLHRKTCSRSCSNTYRAGIRYKIGRPRDKAQLLSDVKKQLSALRGAKCERCGYDTYEVLQVHHKNRDNQDNRPENLELICPNCHCEEHYLRK